MAYTAFYLPAAAGGSILKGIGDPWRYLLGALFLLTLLFTSLVFLPLVVARMGVDPESVRERQALQIEPRVDELATYLRVRWDDTYLGQVEGLLRGGRHPEARRTFRAGAGVTWDEADRALADWSAARLEQKLAILVQAARRANAPAPGGRPDQARI